MTEGAKLVYKPVEAFLCTPGLRWEIRLDAESGERVQVLQQWWQGTLGGGYWKDIPEVEAS